jgi:hypothetical protein
MNTKRLATPPEFEWLTALDSKRYEFRRPLASHVCVAVDRDGSEVVAKRQECAGPDGMVTYDSFDTEIEVHPSLKHPRLAEFVAAYPEKRVIVTRYMPGEILAHRYSFKPCDGMEAINVLIHVAEAVSYPKDA